MFSSFPSHLGTSPPPSQPLSSLLALELGQRIAPIETSEEAQVVGDNFVPSHRYDHIGHALGQPCE